MQQARRRGRQRVPGSGPCPRCAAFRQNEALGDRAGGAGGGTGDPGKPNNSTVFGGKGYKAGQFGKMMGEQVAKSNPAGAKDPFFG